MSVYSIGDLLSIVYVHDGIIFDMDNKNLDNFAQELRDTGTDVDNQSQPLDYVGVNIQREEDEAYLFSQQVLITFFQALIDVVISNVRLYNSMLTKQYQPR